MTPRSGPWLARALGWTIARAHRDAILGDLVDDYHASRAEGHGVRAGWILFTDLLRSAVDSRRQSWLDFRARAATDGPGGGPSVLWADLRAGFRQHTSHPVSTASAIVTIALAIGVNTALVSVTHAVLFTPLPFRDPGRLVFVWDDRGGRGAEPLTPARALDLRRRARTLESAALLGHDSMTVTGLGPPERWSGASVSSSFFDVVGAAPALGRTFHAADRGRDLVVLSHRLWQTRLGSDPTVVGKAFVMAGRPRTVVGVMSADFFWPVITAAPTMFDGPDFWANAPANDVPEGPIPTGDEIATNRTAGFVRMVARLAPGATLDAAGDDLRGIARDLGREFPTSDGGHGITLRGVNEQFFGSVRRPLLFLALASSLVVLLACINVANLLVMRLPARGREMAIRVALGAGRGRLARQLFVEALLLAVTGGIAGVLLARASLGAVVALAPAGLGRLDAVAVSGPILAITSLAVLGCGLALGLLPAVIVWRARPMLQLRTAGVALATRPHFRQVLVALEVAFAVALVVGAALFGQSLVRLRGVDVGFDTRNLLTFDVALTGDRAEYQAKQVAFFEDMFQAIRALPGVRAAGGAVTLPIGGDDFAAPVFAEGQPVPAPGAERHVGYQIVGEGWFTTLGVRVLRGRDFTAGDNRRDAPVAIVNETMASLVWPGIDPLGRRIRTTPDDSSTWLTVVGVVSDIHHLGPAAPARPELYEPYYQNSLPFLAVAVRTTGDPLAVVASIRAAVARLEPTQPISGVSTMARHLNRAYGNEAFLSTLTLCFGVLALGLAVVGVYGVVGWSSAQRTREFGLRTALGATPGSLSRLVLRQGMWPVGLGAIVGAGGAVTVAQSIRSLLFDTAAADPALYGVALVTVLAAAGVACWIPARRAARVDPVRALTAEP
ncbi:MAG TPA: ABC transporter permease [Vicinamibacterales bacterium]|nr:ABC transporter permease [Vicinamibacterales bacterium]